MKKLLSFLLVMVLSVTAIIAFVPPIEAEAAPYLSIEMDYSETVKSGTIRYISQIPTNQYFNSKYWPSSAFGGYTSSWNECGTSCISMALSYLGLNYTPKKILEAHNGYTYFDGWKGATYYSYSSSNLSTAIDKYLNGNGQYSPVVVHLNYGSTGNGHYVMIIDKVSSNVYKFVDPADSTVREYTINGTSLNYKGYSNTIDQVCQWYNKDSIICSCDSYDGIGICTGCGKTYDWQSTFDLAAVGTYKVVKDFTPRTDAPYDAATKANSSIKKGTSITVTGCYINAFGNKWYVFKYDDGQLGYVLHEYLELVSYNSLNVICTGFTPAENESLPTGQGYPVFGTVSSNYPLTNVVAMLDGSKYATWIAPNNTTTSFEINPTDINHSLKFGSLSAGKHTITLIATDVHGRTQTFLVRSFSMVSTSCSHSYGSSYKTDANNHWKVCTKCGSSTSIEAHIYTNDCDTSCNTCGATRNASHNYQYSYENSDKYTEKHWQECTLCGDKINEEAHTYKPVLNDNGVHMATLKGHYMGCDICGDLASEEHVYENDCDTICNICNNINSERETSHIYSNDCDSTCNICGEVRSVSDHVYDHDCDTSCNICGLSRPTSHSYDNDCDGECNSCGEVRTVSHYYTSNYLSDKTTHWLKCDICGYDGYAENHIPGESATETTPQRCTVCGYVIQAPLGHSHSFGDTYYYDDYQHWHQCIEDSCGEKTDIAYHVFNNGEVTKEPTETEKGEITYICYICGEKKYQEVDRVVDDEIHTDSEDKINHAECSREANGWQRFWMAIGNFFRMIFGLLPKCVCGEILN